MARMTTPGLVMEAVEVMEGIRQVVQAVALQMRALAQVEACRLPQQAEKRPAGARECSSLVETEV